MMRSSSRLALSEAVRGLEKQLVTNDGMIVRQGMHGISRWDQVVQRLGLLGWAKEADGNIRRQLVSRLLTYPLTLARYVDDLLEGERESGTVGIGILGARAEATLPALYWNQLGVLSGGRNYHLHFIGPQAGGKPEWNKYSVSNTWFTSTTKTKFFEITDDVDDIDFYVMFNSGVGHAKEGLLWRDSLKLLLNSNKRVLFTSFNEADHNRDRQVVENLGFRCDVVDVINPVRSLWEEQYNGEPVQTNFSAFVTL